jgi:hypothetical protein
MDELLFPIFMSIYERMMYTWKRRLFVVVVVVMKKRSALIARYYCEGGSGRLLSRTSSESLRTKRGEMTSAFHAPLRNSLLAHCVVHITVIENMNHLQYIINGWKRKKERNRGGWGFGSLVVGLETDRIRPAASHDSILIPFSSLLLLLSLSLSDCV